MLILRAKLHNYVSIRFAVSIFYYIFAVENFIAMRICIFCGARPNFVKVAPIVRAISRAEVHGRNISYSLVYAGRADDPTLEGSLFSDLQLPRPSRFLDVDCENLNELTGQVMAKFEQYLHEEPCQTVLVVDDLASTMAAAIVTKKQGLKLAHLAAGTRSFDINMPKEINRLVIDGLSDMLFTAGISNNSIANREGAELEKVYMVGNILIDNLRYNHTRIEATPFPEEMQDLANGTYLLFTLNRKALIADTENLQAMLRAMMEAAGNMSVVAPLRGKAAEAVMPVAQESNGLLRIISPLAYLQFAHVAAHARGIITDSGNVAEEATFNGVPCATLNSYTEHIETVKVGTNVLVGEDAERLRQAVKDMVHGQWKQAGIPDRWDGRSAERVVQILMESRV